MYFYKKKLTNLLCCFYSNKCICLLTNIIYNCNIFRIFNFFLILNDKTDSDQHLKYVLDLRYFVVHKFPEDGHLGAESYRS